ncbi:MAG: hypothetical protein MUF34_28795 [Polyangiaceae bacterium]|jgi:hypothetical protein|nr:hypothetical protein [Polyangiaceae bacterium]
MAPVSTPRPRHAARAAGIRVRRDYRKLCALGDELRALVEQRPLPNLPDAVTRFEWAGALLDIALVAWRARGHEADTVEEQALVRALDAPPSGGRP